MNLDDSDVTDEMLVEETRLRDVRNRVVPHRRCDKHEQDVPDQESAVECRHDA